MGYMDVRRYFFGVPFYTLSHPFSRGLGFFYAQRRKQRWEM